MPLSKIICHPWAAMVMVNLPTKFEVFISAHYEDIKRDIGCGKWVVCGS